jgi:hypothetical protein
VALREGCRSDRHELAQRLNARPPSWRGLTHGAASLSRSVVVETRIAVLQAKGRRDGLDRAIAELAGEGSRVRRDPSAGSSVWPPRPLGVGRGTTGTMAPIAYTKAFSL